MASSKFQSGANLLLSAILAGGAVYLATKYLKPAVIAKDENGNDIIPEPAYVAKTISRDGISIFCITQEQENEIKAFLGIEPAGISLDEYCRSLSQSQLNAWGNGWIERFNACG